MKKIIHTCVLITACIFLLTPAAFAKSFDLTEEANYNLRFEGPYADARGGWMDISFGDVDNNGVDDLVLFAYKTTYNGTNSGSIWIIYDSLLDSLLSSGSKNIDLGDSANYTVRIDGEAGDYFGLVHDLTDITNDSKLDLIAGSSSADTLSRSNNGTYYIIPNSVLSQFGETTGNTFNMSDTSKYTYRIDGASNGGLFFVSQMSDYNKDGKIDMLLTAGRLSYNGRSKSGSMYVLDNSLISQTTTGNTLDLANSSNFTVRFDGPQSSLFGLTQASFGDFDGNGDVDITVSHTYGSYEGVYRSGGVFIIMNDKIPRSGTGTIIDLNTSTSYNVLFYGGESSYTYLARAGAIDVDTDGKDDIFISNEDVLISGSLLSTYANSDGVAKNLTDSSNYTASLPFIHDVWIDDFNGDGLQNLYLLDVVADFSGTDYGSGYIMKTSVFTSLSGTGNSITVNGTDNFIARYDGGGQYTYFKGWEQGDFNADGKPDIVMGSDWGSDNGYRSGTFWLVLNFPHTITSKLSAGVGGSRTASKITGRVTASRSVTNIAGVQYQVDSNNPASGWTDCSADDSDFNSTTEAYTCTLPTLDFGSHTIYIRAYDENTSYTAQSKYAFHNITINKAGVTQTTSSSSSRTRRPQIQQTATGSNTSAIVKASGDSDTGGQVVAAVVEEDTFDFAGFLSSRIQTSAPTTQTTTQTNILTSTSPGNSIRAGGDTGKLGVRTQGGAIAWQVGPLQDLWFKAHPAPGKDAPRIIPDLHKKSSIVALSYTSDDLVPPGNPNTVFNQDNLKLARSRDGITWEILPTSVVDTVNNTVAALDKVGGYYMIVADSGASSASIPETLGVENSRKDNTSPTTIPHVEDDEDHTEKATIESTEESQKEQQTFIEKISTFINNLLPW